MSRSTMSPSSLSPARRAMVPPTCPAPTSAILLRAMGIPHLCGAERRAQTGPRLTANSTGGQGGGDGRSSPPRTVGGIILALYLDQAGDDALKLESVRATIPAVAGAWRARAFLLARC